MKKERTPSLIREALMSIQLTSWPHLLHQMWKTVLPLQHKHDANVHGAADAAVVTADATGNDAARGGDADQGGQSTDEREE
jgi:hypothetical protein